MRVVFRPDPVPKERLEALGDLCLWLYGQKSTDRKPLVQSQNPDLRRLDDAIGSDSGLIALRRGLPLDVVIDISRGDEELFKGHLLDARHRLQEARGKQLTGDPGDGDTLRVANEILELADRLVSDMEGSPSTATSESSQNQFLVVTLGIGSPLASGDSTTQADWLELKALASLDGNSSFQDLVAELRRGGSTDAIQDSMDALVDTRGETSERLADAVFSELEERARSQQGMDTRSLSAIRRSNLAATRRAQVQPTSSCCS